ncbi:hypothetical protein MU715_23990, partial [Salmonella enterica subsp. enterica serovar Enteritidis]|nr:hypothetical protein [Salmonella enterica subsp. enterica serovar Enteritidis]
SHTHAPVMSGASLLLPVLFVPLPFMPGLIKSELTEEMPDYLFRQLGFNQTWHEWKRDEQHRQQQRRPGHY